MDTENLILAWLSWMQSACVWGFGFWFAYRLRSGPLIISMLVLLMSMILRPPIILLGLDFPIPASWFDGREYGTVALGSLFATVWIALFLGFFYLARGIGMPSRGLLPVMRRPLPIATLSIVTVLIVGVSGLITAYLVYRSGGVARFQVAVKLDKSLTGFYALRQFSTLGIVTSILILAHFAGRHPQTALERRIRRRGLVFAGGLILIGFLNNYAWANRYNIAIALLGIGVMWNLHVRRITLVKALILGGIAIAALQSLRALRFDMFSEVMGRDVDPNFNFWQEISLSMHLQEFDAMLLAIRDVGDKFDFRNGADFINGLLSWIPRSLLPSKESYHIGEWLRRVYEPTQVNGWPPSLPGAWYINFGFLGLFLGTLISGVVLAIFDAHYRDRHSPWNVTMGVMLPLLMTSGGVSMGFPQQIVLTLIPIWILAIGLRTRSRKAAFRPYGFT